MPKYMVFMGRMGVREIVWQPHENPVGVYEADTGEEACQLAAQHRSIMGAFFAVEGYFWGTTPGTVPKSFGTKASTEDAMQALLERGDRLDRAIGKLLGTGTGDE